MRKYLILSGFITFLIMATSFCLEVPSGSATDYSSLRELARKINSYNTGSNSRMPVLVKVLLQDKLICGVKSNAPGFSTQSPNNGFDVDYCRAIASAIFGDSTKVDFVIASASDRFALLQDGVIDVLIRTTTHTLSRDSDEKSDFIPTTFYDGQGFMTTPAPGAAIDNLADLKSFLNNKDVCVRENTTTETNLKDLQTEMSGDGLTINILSSADPFTPYFAGACQVVTSDKSALAGEKSVNGDSDDTILGVSISKEPLGPAVLHGDNHWRDLITWVVYATFFADEYGITQANVDTFMPTRAEEERFLGLSGDLGDKLFLANDWAVQIIRAVGNYSEIYVRNLNPIGLNVRGPNQSYKDQGLLYAPPFR